MGFTVLRLVGDIERARKVIAKIVGGAGLQGAAVLHHRLDGEGSVGTGKALVGRLLARQGGKCQYLFGEVRVDAEHREGKSTSILRCGVGSVAFLPKEFGRAEERARTLLPAHNVAPLVEEQRQIAVGVNPAFVGSPDDGLRGGADDQWLLELVTAGVSHHRQFG